jgi:hypothetical protein
MSGIQERRTSSGLPSPATDSRIGYAMKSTVKEADPPQPRIGATTDHQAGHPKPTWRCMVGPWVRWQRPVRPGMSDGANAARGAAYPQRSWTRAAPSATRNPGEDRLGEPYHHRRLSGVRSPVTQWKLPPSHTSLRILSNNGGVQRIRGRLQRIRNGFPRRGQFHRKVTSPQCGPSETRPAARPPRRREPANRR